VTHIYLSPHADDALLSCGGAIHRQARAGDTVRVITLFAGNPPGGDLSPFALEQHGYWGNPPAPMALRRAEDVAASIRIGAELRHLDLIDAVYRAVPGRHWPYTDLTTLFGNADPEDPVTPAHLAEQISALLAAESKVTLYAPLAVGHHVDHQIVHRAARDHLAGQYRLAFYEDYPYAEAGGATESARRAAGGDGWALQAVPLDPEDVEAKVSALGYYRTQLPVLFGGAEAMPSRIWTFAASCCPEAGLAERIWWYG
jgi:LmbE family N-acetylglucosaminyl deacetylase